MGKTPLAITSDFILDETVTLLGRRRGFGATNAARVAQLILSSPRVFTIYVEESILNESLKLYPSYKGRLSLTDVSSVVIMRRYGVARIFSHDHDFDAVEGIRRSESL